MIAAIRTGGLAASPRTGESHLVPTSTATDPVCGMTVTVGPDTPHLRVEGLDYWFCCPGCRSGFAAARERRMTRVAP